MSEELKVTVQIIIDILLLGILVTIIAFFGGVSREALNTKIEENDAMVEITEYKNLYEYTRGKHVNKSAIMDKTGLTYDNILPYNRIAVGSVLNSKNMADFLTVNNYKVTYQGYKDVIAAYRKSFNEGTQTTFPTGLLSGSDIGHFLSAFPQEYNVIVKNSDGKNLLILPRLVDVNLNWYKDANIFVQNPDVWRNYIGETDEEVETNRFNCLKYANNWSLDFLADVIGPENLNSFYYAFAIYDDFTGTFETIVFMKMEG